MTTTTGESASYSGSVVSIERRRGGGEEAAFEGGSVVLLVEPAMSKVRCVVEAEAGVAANFVVDPRIEVVQLSARKVGWSAFDYSGGTLVDTDFEVAFATEGERRAFLEAFGGAQAAMASKIIDDLFDDEPAVAAETFEDEVLRAARSLATGQCGGELGLAKQVVIRMIAGTHPMVTKNSPLRALVDALRSFIEKLPGGAPPEPAPPRAPQPSLAKTRRLKDVLSQLERKIDELERAPGLPDETRRQKLAKYRQNHKIVTTLFALYDKLAAPDAVSDLDVRAAGQLLTQIRHAGETCRKIFEGEALKLVYRLEVARQQRSSETRAVTPPAVPRDDLPPPAVVTPPHQQHDLSLDVTAASPASPLKSPFDFPKSPFELPTSPLGGYAAELPAPQAAAAPTNLRFA